jgi:hypothetical protein
VHYHVNCFGSCTACIAQLTWAYRHHNLQLQEQQG